MMEFDRAKHIFREISNDNYDILERRLYDQRTLVFLNSFFKKNSELHRLAGFLRNSGAHLNLRSNVFTLLYLRGEKNFTKSNLSGIDLFGYAFEDYRFDGSNLEGADLRRCGFQRASLRKTNLSNCSLSDADLRGAQLSGALLVKSDLTGARLTGCCMENTDFTNAHLCGTDLSYAQLSYSDFKKAYLYMCSCRHSTLNNSDMRNSSLMCSDFFRANMENCDLRDSDLRFANLQYACLTQSRCDGADFMGTDLRAAVIPVVIDGINLDMARSEKPILQLIKNPLHFEENNKKKNYPKSSKDESLFIN